MVGRAFWTVQCYAVFFRGLNVGGRNKVDMKELRLSLSKAGLYSVETIGSSGNIVFSSDTPEDSLTVKIEGAVRSIVGKEVLVFLRTSERMKEIVSGDRFPDDDDGKRFITFLRSVPAIPLKVPLRSSSGDAVIIEIDGQEAFGRAYLYKGRYGDVNRLMESKAGVGATTRTYEVVADIVNALRKLDR